MLSQTVDDALRSVVFLAGERPAAHLFQLVSLQSAACEVPLHSRRVARFVA